jgi:hypothetical protein
MFVIREQASHQTDGMRAARQRAKFRVISANALREDRRRTRQLCRLKIESYVNVYV